MPSLLPVESIHLRTFVGHNPVEVVENCVKTDKITQAGQVVT